MAVRLDWLADALRAEGCRVVEEGAWESRHRDGAFDPYGVLWHHTGTTTSYSNPFPTKNTLINGRPDLAGPLCHVGIGYDGVCHIIAGGRANHAGACNGFGPFTSQRDGNDQLVGFEIDYDGTQPMSPEQKDAATRASAAVLKRFGRDEDYAARHAETSTTGKWDTGGLTGDQIRTLIRNYLAGDDDMPLSDDDLDKIALRVWGYKNTAATNKDAYAFQFDVANQVIKTDGTIEAPDRVATPENPTWALSTMIHNMGEWILTCRDYTQAGGPIQAKLDTVQADLDDLRAALEDGGTVIPDPCGEGRGVDATWRVLIIVALLAATVGIMLATR